MESGGYIKAKVKEEYLLLFNSIVVEGSGVKSSN